MGLIGPSGGGKTTLLRLLNGMATPQSGRVVVLGQDLAHLHGQALRRLRSRVGFIHQHLALVPGLRVIRNVVSGRMGHRSLLRTIRDLLFTSRQDTGEILQLLDRVGIPGKLYHRTDQLSGGQQQRAAIARALFQKPEMLLADEPVSSVDPARARATLSLLTRLSSEDGLSLAMSLHDATLAREFFPRLIGLRHGRIVFDGPAAAFDDAAYASLYELDAVTT